MVSSKLRWQAPTECARETADGLFYIERQRRGGRWDCYQQRIKIGHANTESDAKAVCEKHRQLLVKKGCTFTPADERLVRAYPWLRPETIKLLREQGVDPEAYAKQASRLRSDTEEGLTSRVLTPEEEAQIAKEIDEPIGTFLDE